MWDVEYIPDDDDLFFRIHDTFIVRDKLIPGVFRERGTGGKKGMSTDWEKYSSAEDSRDRAKDPAKNSIVSFVTRDLRTLKLDVLHDPEITNRAHTNVKGIDANSAEIRLKLLDLVAWVLKSDHANGAKSD